MLKSFLIILILLFGNPSYIRIQNLDLKIRKTIQEEWDFCKKGSIDAYIAFL